MQDNSFSYMFFGLAVLMFFVFMFWVLWRGPVERMQADGTPYPKEPDWQEREDFVGPLEPCFFYTSEIPSGSYTVASSRIRKADIKWFGAEFNTAEMKTWLNKFGYFHAKNNLQPTMFKNIYHEKKRNQTLNVGEINIERTTPSCYNSLSTQQGQSIMVNVNKILNNIQPVPYVLGNFYRTQDGGLVRFVKVHNEGTSYESMEDESGVNRYSNRDFGRCTGSCHEYSDTRNVRPTYSVEVVVGLVDEIERLKAQLAAFQVNEEDHMPA